ncbi:uncharacterized protein M421DRAFT_267174 [Didymella exigua CBS 183.55]|uniref:Uncharacterized protein n=1 Tax=Didymella exigua CBS 183.55 TaxID=1150837 RepID=A0A6A5RHD6_9PLEO|nr:uncharacterized protein M421DRAFT_267174 [Didymella exigua CBS 183.55]KAF1925017.1 hypothetical protein M421DRAFT_267174 [Didymella exigua CBS 183.55]
MLYVEPDALRRTRCFALNQMLYVELDALRRTRCFTSNQMLYVEPDALRRTRCFTSNQMLYVELDALRRTRCFASNQMLYSDISRAQHQSDERQVSQKKIANLCPFAHKKHGVYRFGSPAAALYATSVDPIAITFTSRNTSHRVDLVPLEPMVVARNALSVRHLLVLPGVGWYRTRWNVTAKVSFDKSCFHIDQPHACRRSWLREFKRHLTLRRMERGKAGQLVASNRADEGAYAVVQGMVGWALDTRVRCGCCPARQMG